MHGGPTGPAAYSFFQTGLPITNIGFPGQIREFVIQINLSCVQIRRLLVQSGLSRVYIPFSSFQIYGIFVRIYVCFIQINEQCASFAIWSFDLAQHDFLTTRRCTSSILIHL